METDLTSKEVQNTSTNTKMKSHTTPSPGEVPIRRLRKGCPGKHIVHFPSLRNDRTVICESRLEADFCVWLEYNQDVDSYLEQPKTLKISIKGKNHFYTPDFRVDYFTGERTYFEIKPLNVTHRSDYLELLDAAEKLLAKDGDNFRLVLETDIRQQPLLTNLRFLYSQQHQVTEHEVAYLKNCLLQLGGSASVRQLCELSVSPSSGSIAKAIFNRQIRINIEQPFGANSILKLQEKGSV